jgi:hypothetical protein
VGQFVYGGDVIGRSGERHDVPTAGVDAVVLLDLRHHADGREYFLGGRGRRTAPTDLRQRSSVHAAVLADFEFSKMESERLDLPDQVLEFPVGLPQGAGRSEAVLHSAQVSQQLVGRTIRQGGAPAPGCRDPVRGKQQRRPVRLLGRPGEQVANELRVFRPGVVDDSADGA